MKALESAIECLGGVVKLASALGIGQPVVSNWRARGNVPAEHCPAIERETRRIAAERGDPSLIVTCEQLRPDVAWEVLRLQAAPPVPEQEAAHG